MTYISSMLPVLLPIALFAVTLIIIFTLRANDNKKRGITTIKKMIEMNISNIEASDHNFKQYASELEQTIARKDAEVKDLIQTVNGQLGELKSYSEDLVRLKNAMDTYREALEGLARLTHDADDKIESVHNEVDRLDKVRTVIDGFRQDMKDADEHLRKHEQRVIQLERESIGRMNDAVSETDNSMDEAMAGLHRESEEIFEDFKSKTDKDTEFRLRKIDDAFQAVIHTVQQFFGELESKIDEARMIADKLPELPAYEPEKITQNQEKTYASDLSHLAQVPPKEADMPVVEIQKPAFKAPRFTPKEDNEVETDIPEDEVEDSYIAPSETDDFAAFGGVVDEGSDLRGMDIMDMDFSTMGEQGAAEDEQKSRWETYGDEEVISFDESSDN